MAEQTRIVFEVADAAAEERLIRNYIAPAFQRIEQRDDTQWPLFNRYAQDPSVETGEVLFYIFGDAESVVNDEQSYWTALADAGMIREWRVEGTGVRISDLDERERFRYRLRSAASRMSLEFFELFDPLPDAFHEFNDEMDSPIGWDFCLHHIINQLGYQENCCEEEVTLLFQCLIARLYAMSIAPGYGVEFAEEKIEELTTTLNSLPPDLQRLHEEYQP